MRFSLMCVGLYPVGPFKVQRKKMASFTQKVPANAIARAMRIQRKMLDGK